MGVSVPRSWRLQSQRYRLIGEVCDHCGQKIFPPRDLCPECGKKVEVQSAALGIPVDEVKKMVNEVIFDEMFAKAGVPRSGKERGG